MKVLSKTIIAVILTCCMIITSLAQSPILLNYQGYLTDADGQALSDDQQITFLLYDRLEGGDPVWDETHDAVTVENGLFNVLLGSVDSTLAVEHFSGERFLGIQIGSDDELAPRMRLASVTHSVMATQAESAYSLNAPSGGPENAVYVADDGKIGVGNTNPAEQLDVTGSVLGDNIAVKVFEGTVNNKTFFDIPNLDGNTHKIYKIYFHGTLHTGETYLLVGPNGDEAAGNFRSWERYDGDASGNWNHATWGILFGRSWIGECDLNAEFTLFCESGRGRFGQGKGMMWYTGDHRSLMLNSWGRWGNTADNISFLRISVKNSAGVTTGTFSGRFIVYALRAR